MTLSEAERQRLFKSRETKPPYASTKIQVACSESFAKTAKELLFELPGRPFRSISELYRHAMAVGLISMAEHGVAVDKLRDLWLLNQQAEEADAVLAAQQAANRLVDKCAALLDGARTRFQVDGAREHVERMIAGCPDDEVVDELKKLLNPRPRLIENSR